MNISSSNNNEHVLSGTQQDIKGCSLIMDKAGSM